MISTLKKGILNDFHGMLLVKENRPDWEIPTLLMRWVDEKGTNVAFFVTGEARTPFLAMEPLRIYDGQIKGLCVRNASRSANNGVASNVEVHLKFPTKFTLSKKSLAFETDVQFSRLDNIE